ncbi:MAG: DUF1080 domain-containing protein [Candidatus Hydrogenedentes bacterium]|nr:DUF1080 domain-containing protein [Candidatus Hydrogenedentota bacterium]
MRHLIAGFLVWTVLAVIARADATVFLGRWALTSEGGGPGWLEVRQDDGVFAGALLWIGGSPETQTRIYFDGDTLHAIRIREDEIRDTSGKVVRKQIHPILLTATVSGDELNGELTEPSTDGLAVIKQTFTGRRIPPLPQAPDLTRVRFGEPIVLFDGKSLDGWIPLGGAHWGPLETARPGAKVDGWIPVDPSATNGWSVREGVLVNEPAQHEGETYIRYANLHTAREFEDFNLTLEVNLPPDGNSGIYLRGIYEVQLRDSHGKPLDCHNMGAIYGRITPTVAAEKPAGEWQSLDITLVDRHATVKLNGQTIIENQPIAGCTGGALWSDESRPGPLYIQGDHTGVQLRNMVLRPVIK